MANSSILILSSAPVLLPIITKILHHYFPSKEKNSICISNKYYTAEIQLCYEKLVEINKSSHQQNENQQMTHDFILFLLNQDQPLIQTTLNHYIFKYQPDSYLLLVHTQNPLLPWKYKSLLEESDAFIQVIQEDVIKFQKQRPQRKKMGLLNQDFEGIFAFFEAMETTQWRSMKRKGQQPALATEKPTANEKTIIPVNQKIVKNEHQMEDPDEIQKEMQEFETMMQQMLAIKTQGPKTDSQRKRNAEELMAKLMKSIGDIDV